MTQQIKGYEFSRRDSVGFYDEDRGGFDVKKQKFKPMKLAGGDYMIHEVLDAVTAAVEAGIVEQHTWPKQIFKTGADLEAFLDDFSNYDECYRVHDRWWQALANLAGSTNCEEGFSTTSDMADTLREYVADMPEVLRKLKAKEAYFKNPVPALELTGPQEKALQKHNAAVEKQFYSARPREEGETLHYPFTNRFLTFVEGVLSAREATAKDLAALVAKPAAKKGKSKATA